MQPEPPPWYHAGLSFTCTHCGRCCGGAPGHVWVSPEEMNAIAEHLRLPLDQFQRRHTRRAERGRSLLEHADGDCEFLRRQADGKAYCGIYEVRPLQCRTWPFWKSNLRSLRAWKLTGRDCPGINQGTHHPLPVIQAALARNAAGGLNL